MTPGRLLTAAMIVFALVVVPTAAYVGAYYGLAMETTGPFGQHTEVYRFYRYRWQANVFKLGGSVEAWLTGNTVEVISIDDTYQ